MDNTFDAQTLARDLTEVHRNYTTFFAQLTAADWNRPSPRGETEWNLRETVAHLVALTQLGNRGIQAALRGESLDVPGLTSRYGFSDFNRQEIDRRLHLPDQTLSAAFLDELSQSIQIARDLKLSQQDCTAELPIYNRPLTVVETLGIQVFHPGLHHSAQVADPVNVPPLWTHLTPDVRHRIIGRVMRALSVLYRYDLGGNLRAVMVFEVGGEGGGQWYVNVSPDSTRSGEESALRADFRLTFRDTSIFCRMFTGRLNLIAALLTGQLRYQGDPRLLFRFGSLFSVDARK